MYVLVWYKATIEHPFLNVVESITSDCRCIIDSSNGRIWENPSLNIRSRTLLLVMQTKSRRCSHNFASLNLEFSLLFSLYSTLINAENHSGLLDIRTL